MISIENNEALLKPLNNIAKAMGRGKNNLLNFAEIGPGNYLLPARIENSELSISTWIHDVRGESDEVEFPANQALDFLYSLTGPDITINKNGGNVPNISSRVASSDIDFPEKFKRSNWELPTKLNFVRLHRADLLAGLEATMAFTSDEIRYNLTAIQVLSEGNNKLRFTSTNAFLLSQKLIDSPFYNVPEEFEVRISKEAAVAMVKLLKADQEIDKVRLLLDQEKTGCLYTEDGKYSIHYRISQGEFPNYKKVLPNPDKCSHFTMFREDLTVLFKQMKALNKGWDIPVVLDTQSDISKLMIGMKTPSNCKSLKAAASISKGEDYTPIRVGLNLKYLMAAMKHITSDFIHVEHSAFDEGVSFSSPDMSQKIFIMPMRIEQ